MKNERSYKSASFILTTLFFLFIIVFSLSKALAFETPKSRRFFDDLYLGQFVAIKENDFSFELIILDGGLNQFKIIQIEETYITVQDFTELVELKIPKNFIKSIKKLKPIQERK